MRLEPLRDPATYAGEFVCARCGSGWPNCEVDLQVGWWS